MQSLNKKLESIEGWLNPPVAHLLFNLSSRLSGTGAVVEIGSWQGKSTLCLAMGLEKSGLGSIVYAIDPHTGSQEHHHLYSSVNTYKKFWENITSFGMQHRVNPLKMKSEEAVGKVKNPIELLWVDGDHEYSSVKKDFDLWFPKLMNGGWIAFHDSKWPGVRRVLWEELYPSKCVGIIRRVEDTTYVKKLEEAPQWICAINQLNLLYQQTKQRLKRLKRRLRKKTQRNNYFRWMSAQLLGVSNKRT